MTICIGTVCADLDGNAAKVVVVAADRMVTIGHIQEFEHDVPKVSKITNKVVALVAGDALVGTRLAHELTDMFRENAPSVKQVAEAATLLFQQFRSEHLETVLFKPCGLTLAQFYGEIQTKLLPQIVGGLDQEVHRFDPGYLLLIAGVDGEGAHVFTILNPGLMRECFPIGYSAIGSGDLQALQSLIGSSHTPARGLYETLFATYAAKRRAEVAVGVGRDTDVYIISDPGGIKELTQDELKQMSDIYEEYEQAIHQQMRDRVAKLQIFKEVRSDAKEEHAAKS